MTDGVLWLERYSVIILPVLAVCEQMGLPLPAVPGLALTSRRPPFTIMHIVHKLVPRK